MTDRCKNIFSRISKAVTLYAVYLLTTVFVPFYMNSWRDNENLHGFWSAPTLAAVGYVYSFFILFSLISIFVLHDRDYRLHFLENESGLNSTARKLTFIIRSKEFWIDIATLCVIAAVVPGAPYSQLRNGFLVSVAGVWHFPIFLGISFIALFFFSLVSYYSTLNWWARPAEKRRERLKKKDVTDWIKQVVSSVVIYEAGAFALPVVIPFVWSILLTAWIFVVTLTVAAAAMIVVVISYKYVRALYHRRRLLKKMKKALESGYCRAVSIKNIYRSVFSYCGGENIILEREGQKYYCKIVTPLRKREHVVFDEKGRVTFVRNLLAAEHLRTEDYYFDADEGAKRIIIVNPGALRIYVTDGLHNSELQSGDKIMGYYVYRTDNFINAIDIRYL